MILFKKRTQIGYIRTQSDIPIIDYVITEIFFLGIKIYKSDTNTGYSRS